MLKTFIENLLHLFCFLKKFLTFLQNTRWILTGRKDGAAVRLSLL